MMYLYFLIIASSASASISAKSGLAKCPVACRCDGSRKRVYCNSRALKSIPTDIPIDTKVLYLQDNQLASSEELDITLSTLVNLERVMLYSNQLTQIPKFNSKSLHELRLNSNKISTIPENVFEGTPNLRQMILDDNEITNFSFKNNSLIDLPNLQRLSLIQNRLTELPESLPSTVEELFLTSNQISFIGKAALGALQELRVLQLDRNRVTDESFECSFGGKLAEIDLSYNMLENVPKLNPAIEKIRLTANKIQFVSRNDLEPAARLKTIDLSYNSIKRVENGSFSRLFDLNRVEIAGNDFLCDCHLKDLKFFLEETQTSTTDMIICADQKNLGKTLSQVNDLSCEPIEFKIENQIIAAAEPMNFPPFHMVDIVYYENQSEDRSEGEPEVRFPMTHTHFDFSSMSPGQYTVCMVHKTEIPTTNDCKTLQVAEKQIKTAQSSQSQTQLDSTAISIETIVGAFFGILTIAILTIAIALLCSRRTQSDFDIADDESSSKLSYCSKLTSLSGSHKQSADCKEGSAAGDEFAFTLMLRSESNYLPNLIQAYPGQQINQSQSPIPSSNFQQPSLTVDSRNDQSMYI